jgi:hypothetical protein
MAVGLGKWIVVFSMLIFCASAQSATYGGGSGTTEDPYQIWTAEQMNTIGVNSTDWSKHFKLMANIDMSVYPGTLYKVIGNLNTNFTGIFDGNGHTISNFTYQSVNNNSIGLFGCVYDVNAIIKDLDLINSNVNGGTGDRIGSLVGFLGSGIIRGCSVKNGTLSGDDNIGILVGWNSGLIESCYTSGTVSGDERVGGLVGENWDGRILNSHARTFVSGHSYIAGLVGHSHSGMIERSSAIGDVAGTDYATGGLVGENWSVIRSCFTTGTTVGYYATGGLMGSDFGTVSNCYAGGTVQGTFNDAGGLLGKSSGLVSNCYATTKVSGNGTVGGLVGENAFASYSKCFWDKTVNPDLNGIENTTDPNVVGKTTIEMLTESTFTDAGWDFIEIWDIGESQTYPYLRVYSAGDLNHDHSTNFVDFVIFTDHWLEN